MIDTNKLDALKGTKFLFDENLISYGELVQLLEDNGLNTKFIKKPLEENLRVHSLYIKSDFEVAFLAYSNSADSIYDVAGDFIKQYTETTLYEVLKLLGYCDIQLSKPKKEKKLKKSKFVTFEHDDSICSYKKKEIKSIIYMKEIKKLYINRTFKKVIDISLENVDLELYNHIMSQL